MEAHRPKVRGSGGIVQKDAGIKVRPKGPKPPKVLAAEERYYKFLKRYIESIRKEVFRKIIPAYLKAQEELAREEASKTEQEDSQKARMGLDSADGTGRTPRPVTEGFLLTLEAQRREDTLWDFFSSIVDPTIWDSILKATGKFSGTLIRKIIGNHFNLTDRVQLNNWKMIARAGGIGDIRESSPHLRDISRTHIKRNVALIKSIDKTLHGQLKDLIRKEFGKGTHVEKLSKLIGERFEVAESRARLIAKDQTNKLFGQLQKTRQEEVGVEEYIWRNSGDNRVRGKPGGLYPDSRYNHWEREGKRFSWKEPPPDGHPGEAVGCRCWAEPVIPEEEED